MIDTTWERPQDNESLRVFRQKRDEYALHGYSQALPSLSAKLEALWGEIEALQEQVDAMGVRSTKGLSWEAFQVAQQHNHKRDDIYDKKIEKMWTYQELWARVSAIEADAPKRCANLGINAKDWRAQVFTVNVEETKVA